MAEPLDILLVLAPPVWVPEAPPMGPAYLHEHLRRQGLRSAVLDLNERVYNLGGERRRGFWQMEHAAELTEAGRAGGVFEALRPVIEQVLAPYLARPPRAVGFSTYHLNTQIAGAVAGIFRERAPGTRVIFGGPSMLETDERRKLPDGAVDYVMLGEGEQRLATLLSAIREGAPVPEMPGVLGPGEYARAAPMETSFIAGDLPADLFPRYEGFDLAAYRERHLPILMARGCPFGCAFCNDQFVPYRRREPDAVIDEIRHHVFVHGTQEFFFCDQSLNASVKHLQAVLDRIIAARLPIRWWGQINVRRGLGADLLTRMKNAGCVHLSWGVESLADPVLRAIRKPCTAEMAEQVLVLAHDAGIEQLVYLIVGLPGETEDTFRETLARVRRIAPHVDRFSIMPAQVVPFSPLGEDPAAFGIDLSGPEAKNRWWSLDGLNTYERRMAWLTELIETLLELGVPFQSPVINRARYAELLGREVDLD